MKCYFVLVILPFAAFARAQPDTLRPARPQQQDPDTMHILQSVTVRGFETRSNLLETPASVSTVSQKTIQRFAGYSLVPALNVAPGVRMEERSPGSYRLSIRGSLLRSPFGIRNIKVYMDDIPFTDAGGNTYLNLIEPAALGTAEVLKGPAASLYGAGTGGAVILSSPRFGNDTAVAATRSFRLLTGSYGLLHQQLQWRQNGRRLQWQLAQSHLQSNGYRSNSRMKREMMHWNGRWQPCKALELKSHLLFTDLYYQTPGGLTESQWTSNPVQARPATAALPGAVQQRAAVYNKTVFAGLSSTLRMNRRITNTTSLMYSHTKFQNPFITNYERRNENNRGLRSQFEYKTNISGAGLSLLAGGEWQSGGYRIDNFGNRGGVPDTVQAMDEVGTYQRFGFFQANAQIHNKWFINAGISYNGFTYRYRRISNVPATAQQVKVFKPVVSPRLSVLYKPFRNWTVRAALSKGFSPPTLAELRPSEGSFFDALQPEYGWNYEAGIRAGLQRLQLDITLYNFELRDAIVRRTASSGAEYFVNAGGTRQQGLEAALSGTLVQRQSGFIQGLRLWSSLTLNRYRFRNYQSGTAVFSGNRVTGVPHTIVVGGIDGHLKNGLYLNGTYTYTSALPLNDANAFFAAEYHLLQCRLGYKVKMHNIGFEIFAGGDNLLNENYSLGNDLNAVGNRFYNGAPARNYFAGLTLLF